MSSRDYQLYGENLQALVGRKCFATMATNSIKLQIDEDKKNGIYLWIDPPWAFGKGEEPITDSGLCPHSAEPGHEPQFRQWLGLMNPIARTEIRDLSAERSGRLRIVFDEGYELVIPAQEASVEADLWYDHWYYSESIQS